MDKEYLAIVTGELPEEDGIIEAPIARKEGSIIERCVNENGKYAKTSYKLLSKRNGLSLVQVKLFTGRTHQIRVHMAHIGCPLFNDNLYGTPGPQSRHALHAFKLRFIHPVSDTPLEITRTLPEDLRKIIYY
jgi:23S rRNA pseudouridine1911/1915/1917 synthase